ncbi:EAL domain-containing protein [Hydrogenophaga sp.]|uniref:sensor domain-containing protein n=1 Tax=Hydrogenophaga sp. TaxID=1904254 RepID=UPI0035662421
MPTGPQADRSDLSHFPDAHVGLQELHTQLDQLARLACRLCGTRAALLIEQAPEQARVLGSHGLSATGCASAARACSPLLTEDPDRKGETSSSREGSQLSAEALRPLNSSSADLCFCHAVVLPELTTGNRTLLVLLSKAPCDHLVFVPEDLEGLAQQAALLLNLARRHPPTSARILGQGAANAQALWESQSRRDMVEQTARVGSWSIDLVSGLGVYSDEYAAILGLETANRQTTFEQLVQSCNPEWQSGIRQRLERCATTGAGFDEEVQVLVPGLGSKWVRTVAAAVRNEDGDILRIHGAMQDISAQKQAQQETLRLAMRLTTTLASITEAFVTLDRQCCFTYLNQESERLLQKTTADLLGLEVWHDFPPDVGQRMRTQLERAIKTNRRQEFEDHFPSLGKWLEVRAYPFAEGLAVYFRDVTERHRAQEQLMLLETSVSRLNDIVVIAEAGVNSDQEPRIVFVNDAFELHTGYSRADVLGQTPRMLLGLDPTISKLRELSLGLHNTQQARTELMVRRKNNAWFWVELEVVSVLSTNQTVSHWVAVGRDITQRKEAEDEIHHLAFYDALTDLPNRQLLMDRLTHALEQCAETGEQGALMFIDLDNFKILNDTLGHHKGDLLLQKVARRLAQSVRKTNTVARLGGDEFVIMVDDLGTDPEAAAYKADVVAKKVLNTLRVPFDLDGHQHYATPSIGVTSFNGQHDDVTELLKQADLAMYQAKTMGRNTLCFFDPRMQATMSANAAVSSDLRNGLKDHQFVVHYQPQVNRLGAFTGVEALVRWQHPRRGLIRPADFIPVAEDTGLILPLGQWVLETVCAQLASWAQRPETSDLSAAVNVSVRQFRHPDFVDMVMSAIRRSGIRPQKLKLELTESLLADRMEITIEKMGMLKELGVTLALDDFGVGYSSLSYLKRLPLDQLKIDKGFVADVLTDPNDAAISRAIIALAQSLSLQVVAEGVETQEQRDFLARQGCDQFQGHLFAPALPIEELEAFLEGKMSTGLLPH